jgi:hypothetical protein
MAHGIIKLSTPSNKMTEWMKHVKATMKQNPGKSLAEVLKMAKKTYKKKRGGADETMKGGFLVKVGGASCMGGRRRRHTRKHRGGQLFGFGQADGTLSDGNGRMTPIGSVADASQGGLTTTALPEPVRAAQLTPAPAGGRRRHRKTRRHSRK